MTRDPHDLLRLYVRDHHAASAGGVSLARRSAHNNAGTEFEPSLRELADEIAADRRSLAKVMRWLAVSPSPVRLFVVRLGEVLARLKWNGRVVHYSPTSRILELEALVAGVSAKRQLWRTLRAVAAHDVTFADPVALSELAALDDGATRQLDCIIGMHRRAVKLAVVESAHGAPQQDWFWGDWVSAIRGRMNTDARGATTMPLRSPSPTINDRDQYEALRDEGMSKEKAARIANASARDGRSAVAHRGGKAEDYDDRTKAELLDRARELDIDGRSKMTKDQLIDALRHH